MEEVVAVTGDLIDLMVDELKNKQNIVLTGTQEDKIWDSIQGVLEEYCTGDYKNHN
jgi:hypothetical protein